MSQQQPAWQVWMYANAALFTDVEYPVTNVAREASCLFGGKVGHDEYENYLEQLYYNRARAVFKSLGLDMKQDDI